MPSRSLIGRTSFLWAAGFAFFLALSAVRFVGPSPAARSAGRTIELYFVESHRRLGFGVEVGFLTFALIYLLLETARRGRWRARLGGLHFAGTMAGVLLLSLPVIFLTLAPASAVASPATIFAWMSGLSAAGYAIVLAAQVFFVAALLDALRREPDPG